MRINANHYSATSQLVSAAIDRSISHDEIVTIEANTSRFDGVCSELFEACEGDADNNGVHEYWGELDGNQWRVHVEVIQNNEAQSIAK